MATSMSDDHKAALAKGRSEDKAVRAYLEGLRATKPRRGRKRTADTIEKRLAKVDDELADASPINELALVQERRNLLVELENTQSTIDIDALKTGFVDVAQSFGTAKGIEYSTWRDVGVPATVLKSAGITRSS